jgi:sec-independent protein translocase protein TatA
MIENLFQPTHLMLVLAIALLVFGPKNLPQIGKGMGEAIRGFKDAVKRHRPETRATFIVRRTP